uniref:S2 protein n=1 Tax=Equine infectious anemia virus TaxID=11665 RepID=Q9E6G0_9RETR|nr:S2 protein [Equine infectious anemia virus]
MGLFGKGVTWSASHSMGGSQGESQPLLPNSQKNPSMRKTQCFNLIVIIMTVRTAWQNRRKQETKK